MVDENMITFIAAEIGAGKSCYAAKIAKQAIKKGKTVYSSDFIKGCYKIEVEQLIKLRPVSNSLIILDETGNSINSRNFAKINLSIIEFMKLSRHYHCDVILISQTFNDSDKQIRELASKVLLIRPLIHGLLSMVVRCHGKLGIGIDGNFAVKYKIGRIGGLILLPMYFKYFNSYSTPLRDLIPLEPWEKQYPECSANRRCGAPDGSYPQLVARG